MSIEASTINIVKGILICLVLIGLVKSGIAYGELLMALRN